MKYLSLMTMGVVFLMSANLPASIEIYNEDPVEDAYVDDLATGDTFNLDMLHVQGLGPDNLPGVNIESRQRSIFKFNVSELAERTILSVEFGVYVIASSSQFNTPSLHLTYLEDDTWSEGPEDSINQVGISWDDQPLPGSSVFIGANSEQVDAVKYYSWIVYIKDSAFTHWYDDHLAGDGFASYMVTIGNEDDTSYAYFPSSEYADDTIRPYLKIVHVPEPATLALLGLGAMLVRKRRAR